MRVFFSLSILICHYNIFLQLLNTMMMFVNVIVGNMVVLMCVSDGV